MRQENSQSNKCAACEESWARVDEANRGPDLIRWRLLENFFSQTMETYGWRKYLSEVITNYLSPKIH
jgi:hypothetical protein